MDGFLFKLRRLKIKDYWNMTQTDNLRGNDYIPLYSNVQAVSPVQHSDGTTANRLGLDRNDDEEDQFRRMADDDDKQPITTRPSREDHVPLRGARRFGWWIRCLTFCLALLFIGFIFGLWVSVPPTPSAKSIDYRLPEQDQLSQCDSFQQLGYLNYDADHPLENNWLPFNQACQRVDFLTPLVQDLQKFSRGGIDHRSTQVRSLPWLVNRTVVLMGDSIERYHARDLCDLLSASTEPPFHSISDNGFTPTQSTNQTPSQSFFVSSSSRLKPSRWYFDPLNHQAVPPDWPIEHNQTYLDHHEEWADRDNIRTSPWICEVPSYGFRIVTLFTYGIEPLKAGWYIFNNDWYFSPSSYIDRFHHTLIPLLENLSKERQAPQILKPDLIEVSSGLWDIRQWSEEDTRNANIPLDDSTEIVYQPLSLDRLNWWKDRVIKLLKDVDSTFSRDEMFPSSTILWRSLHIPLKDPVNPFSRVEQLDQFGRFVVTSLQNDSSNARLANRLKIDSWGRKMLGQQNHFRDRVHPKAIPGSVLWAQMMLWELKNSISRTSRNLNMTKN